MEPILEAWERLQEYIQACPHHGMESWLVLQSFYNGLTPMSRGHLYAAAGGVFLSLTINEAMALIEKMVTNRGWGEDRAPSKT
jgi:drug/metabolite transporter superfamily protein YnfA